MSETKKTSLNTKNIYFTGKMTDVMELQAFHYIHILEISWVTDCISSLYLISIWNLTRRFKVISIILGKSLCKQQDVERDQTTVKA